VIVATIAPLAGSTRWTVPSAALATQIEPNAGTGRSARWARAIGASDDVGAAGAEDAQDVVSVIRALTKIASHR